MVLNRFLYLLFLRPVHFGSHDATCIIRFFCADSFDPFYAETKEMIYESVNLKGVLYEPKPNSFILQLFCFQLLRSFIKFIY